MSKSTFKIVVIGDMGCGKTCLLKRFTENTYAEEQPATVTGVIKSINLDGRYGTGNS